MSDFTVFTITILLWLVCVWIKMLLNDFRTKRRLERERLAEIERQARKQKFKGSNNE